MEHTDNTTEPAAADVNEAGKRAATDPAPAPHARKMRHHLLYGLVANPAGSSGEPVHDRIAYDLPEGDFGKYTRVEKGRLIFTGAFQDDIVAFLAAQLQASPMADQLITRLLALATIASDARAVMTNGYSHSAEQKDFKFDEPAPAAADGFVSLAPQLDPRAMGLDDQQLGEFTLALATVFDGLPKVSLPALTMIVRGMYYPRTGKGARPAAATPASADAAAPADV